MYTDKSLIGKTVIFKKDVKTASLLGPCNLLEGEEIEILKASERYANCYEVLSKSSKEKVWVMQRNHLSKEYTTNWEQLLTIKI